MTQHQKITFGEMRYMGVRGLLIYCSDYKCSNWIAVNGDRWSDDLRLSDLGPRPAAVGSPDRRSLLAWGMRGVAYRSALWFAA